MPTWQLNDWLIFSENITASWGNMGLLKKSFLFFVPIFTSRQNRLLTVEISIYKPKGTNVAMLANK
jgi:hypothetical protein